MKSQRVLACRTAPTVLAPPIPPRESFSFKTKWRYWSLASVDRFLALLPLRCGRLGRPVRHATRLVEGGAGGSPRHFGKGRSDPGALLLEEEKVRHATRGLSHLWSSKAVGLVASGLVLWAAEVWAQAEAHVPTPGKIDTGDTAWVLAASALVLAMVASGL